MLMCEKALSRRAHLEALFKKYPAANREVIFKEEILREGYSFTEAALRVTEKHRQPFYNVYIYDRVSKDQFHHNEHLRAPDYIHLHGGLYDLRGSVTIGQILVPDSPYVVDVVDGKIQLCEREGDRMIPLAELKEYGPVPEYWSRCFEDGELMCHQAGPGWVTAFNNCQYWGPKEECIFCNINVSAREARERGEVGRLPYKDPYKVGLALEEQYKRCQWPAGQRPDWVRITGGQITGKLAGKQEIDFYLQYVDAIVERIGQVWPINLAMTPQRREGARRLKEHGVHTRSVNFEVWDRELFRFVCPGKEKYVGRDEWIRRTMEEIEVFGVNGHVSPRFVAGIEVMKPRGFDTIEEGLESTREGLEFFMSHGAVPRPISLRIEQGTVLSRLVGRDAYPPVDYFIQLDILWYELWQKHRPGHVDGKDPIGPGVNRYGYNAAEDMGV